MELIQELNYICNSDIFQIAYCMKETLPNRDDRNKVTLWIAKIMRTNKTLSDLRMRNRFMHILVRNVHEGKLSEPFNLDPPKAALKTLVRQLPEPEDVSGQEDESLAMLRFLPAENGGFLLPKPLPNIGAYCYIAATSQGECVKKCNFN